jgi:hypothetical protein
MGKYQEIVAGSWEMKSVFPESVPHLFHHDMTYLWVLEQQPDQRPQTWLVKIEAWKVLIRLFFLDQLKVEHEELRSPLVEVTDRFGIRRVTWLRNKQSNQPVGVLSPTIIARPLPDFTDHDVDRWRMDLKDNEREFSHLVYVAIQDLERAAGASPFARRIADILRREFAPASTTNRPPAGRAIAVPLLNRLTWEKREGEAPPVGTLDLAVRAGTERTIDEYIPICADCGRRLLREETAPPIDVEDVDVIHIRCSNAQCTKPEQTIPLESFGIWLRSSGMAVHWSPEQLPPMPGLRLPPEPMNVGNELIYEWNSAAIGGEHERRFLRLRFPDRRVQTVPLMSIFFSRLVVPGVFDSFKGSAVLPEWIDALNPARAAAIRPSSDLSQIEFRNLKVRGWPVEFSRFYKELSLQREPELSLGLFPDPTVVGVAWRWYRGFAHGRGAERFEVSAVGGTRLLRSLVTFETGVPASVSLRSLEDPSVGVSYIPERRERSEEYGGVATASMAVDFGTTNTVVYHQPAGARKVARAETHGLNPRKVAEKALWLADAQNWDGDEIVASFLAGPGYRPGVADPYLVPSEVWRTGRQGLHLIHWAGEHPEGKQFSPVALFKWDPQESTEGSFGPTRRAFLAELLLQFLPLVIASFDPARVTEVQIGFSFPLAFEHSARKEYREILQWLAGDLTRLTGLVVNTSFSINESKACVNAFGSFNGETFLVADMGGGTLDVALFSYDPDSTIRIHQMGSLRFAGERCVAALAVQLSDPGNAQQLRDAIARGESHRKYGKQTAERVATQFSTIAFEFLRTMVASYRSLSRKGKEKSNEKEKIFVVLIGNGWHLVEAFSSETTVRGGKNVYREAYADMVESVGDPSLIFYDERPLPEFPSSKHLVVAGALQNVTSQSPVHELGVEDYNPLAKLPSGRSFEIGGTMIPWTTLVGEGIKLPGGLDLGTSGQAKIRVQMKETPGDPSDAWVTRFSNSVGASKGSIPYPSEPELLRELRETMAGSPPRMKRGPLQLILELEWSEALKRPRGGVQ